MKRFLLIAMLTFWLAIEAAPVAQAGVISRDWKTPGDGLLTYDDVNQREWLDLTETLLIKFPGTVPSSIIQPYQNVLAQTATGGLFAGFTAASQSDVVALAQSAGIDTSTFSYDVNSTTSNNLIDLLGPTRSFASGGRWSLGLTVDYPSTVFVRALPSLDDAGLTLSPVNLDPAGIPPITGVWLYRQVPEPSSVLLSLACLLCLRGVVL